MNIYQYDKFQERVHKSPQPCKYGHYDCSDRLGGMCSDEEYPEEYRTEDEKSMNPDYEGPPC